MQKINEAVIFISSYINSLQLFNKFPDEIKNIQYNNRKIFEKEAQRSYIGVELFCDKICNIRIYGEVTVLLLVGCQIIIYGF